MVADTKLVPDNDAVKCRLPYDSTAEENHIDTTTPQEQVIFTVPWNPASSHTFIRKAMRDWEPPEEVIHIICLSWRGSTVSRYDRTLRKWKNYWSQRDVDPLDTSLKTVLDLLHGIYERGCRCIGICAAKSALSSAVTIPGYERMSNHPVISQYVKSIYSKHAPLSKYVNLWDLNKILTYYDIMGPNIELIFHSHINGIQNALHI